MLSSFSSSLLSKLIELYHAGGFVMPPLLLGAAALWYAMTYRVMLLSRGKVGAFMDFRERLSSQDSKEDAYFLLSEEEDNLNKNKTLIKTIVVIAPLLGLLGTVSGMIETFDSLADMSLFSQSGGIAGGISQALITTQMGLAVAIPGLIIGRLLDRKQHALINEMEIMIEDNWTDRVVHHYWEEMQGETNA